MNQNDTMNNLKKSLNKGTNVFNKAKKAVVDAMDQNDDGKLDFRDVSIVAGSLGATMKKKVADAVDSAKESGDLWNEKRVQQRQEAERNTLRPVFRGDVEKPGFALPKLIRIAEMDKKHAESEICRGAVGYESVFKDLKVINIFSDAIDAFPISLYPEKTTGAYYVDPVFENRYIVMDEYFTYLKVARINELQKIAQDLGAKHFRVIYRDRSKDFVAKKANGLLSAKWISGKMEAGASAQHDAAYEDASRVSIAAEMEFEGHAPVEPNLVYLKKETCIQMLIALRMGSNSMKHQKYTLKLSNSSGIKVNDAIKIDGALSALKCAGNVAVASEAQKEAERFFEYEIDF